MLPPNNQSLNDIQRETGIPEGALKKWRNELRVKGFAAPAGEQQSEEWSTRDKFLIVVETATLSEIELAEYCRKKGLYVEQEWAKDMNTNDKDIVFVLNPQPFIDAGADPNKVEGWTFAKVEVKDDQGNTVEVDKLLKPFDLN